MIPSQEEKEENSLNMVQREDQGSMWGDDRILEEEENTTKNEANKLARGPHNTRKEKKEKINSW